MRIATISRRIGIRVYTAKLFKPQKSPFCTRNEPTTNPSNNNTDGAKGSSAMSRYDAYKELDNLNVTTAAKILLTAPKKKFGLDFHLVQLFFVCMPSLAVYLVAQYARYEMRRMEAELELKKQAEEEAKAKEIESEEKAASILDPELQDVKVRLHKVEKTLNEIATEYGKQPDAARNKSHEEGKAKITGQSTNSNSLVKEGSSSEQTSVGRPISSVSGNSGGIAPVGEENQLDRMDNQKGGRSDNAKK